jgi:hypothetical protein
LETALELGIAFEVAPKLSLEDGIEAVRKSLPNCWFDKNKFDYGIESLKSYNNKRDDTIQCFWNRTLHHN